MLLTEKEEAISVRGAVLWLRVEGNITYREDVIGES